MTNFDDKPIPYPTYMQHIRHFFTLGDIGCMKRGGIDLASYYGVKFNAQRIYFRVEDGSMPPGPSRWSEAKVKTFYNWMKTGYIRGFVEPNILNLSLVERAPASRLRKNINDLSEGEIKRLKLAFSGLMARDEDRDNPQSYFNLAGLHWLPRPNVYCRHHENAYNPWHRLYMNTFEDALRSVDGCEDVTLPYWDITEDEIPPLLKEEPFNSYKIPYKLETLSGHVFPAGTETERFDDQEILDHIKEYGVAENIAYALGESRWEHFNGWSSGQRQKGIILAHDGGHNSIGDTMKYQEVAAFDPIFWFFHSNWDRLWWKWQTLYGADDTGSFITFIDEKPDWILDPLLNTLDPFKHSVPETINLRDFDIDYEHPEDERIEVAKVALLGSIRAEKTFSLQDSSTVSVRVKNINRLGIPGSFDVRLKSGDEVLAKQSLFQPMDPEHCGTCKQKGLVDFDFELAREMIEGKPLQVEIAVNVPGRREKRVIPLGVAGNPTVNIRSLLVQE